MTMPSENINAEAEEALLREALAAFAADPEYIIRIARAASIAFAKEERRKAVRATVSDEDAQQEANERTRAKRAAETGLIQARTVEGGVAAEAVETPEERQRRRARESMRRARARERAARAAAAPEAREAALARAEAFARSRGL